MSVQVKRRRDTAANNAAFTGAPGEIVVDTTNNRMIVHDGATIGGFAAAKLSEVVTNTRRAVADAATTIVAGDRLVAYISLTASRVVTLCAASAFPTGAVLTIVDESGACSATDTITVMASGTDMINGAVSYVLQSAHAYVAFESNGSGKWTVVDQFQVPIAALNNVGIICFTARNVNLNATGDTAVPISMPAGTSRYRLNFVAIDNSQGALPTTARLGIYTAASQGGVAIASPQALSAITSQSTDTAGNLMVAVLNNAATTSFVDATLYVNVGTAQGTPATVDVVIFLFPL
ncbi:hypothetical protein [Methylocapsa sp. S129]|uniref:hyaluronate lyase N-terminal domain-containing protein n=1 Tax=Methylocapsa sp. S129 TaxID=1641869 RepID=UPI00131CDF10|nr:hypothetical protein [Methylocapsa sp. S129]